MIDLFLRKVFVFSRVIASIIIFVCLLVMIISGFMYITSGPKGVKTPDFDDIIETTEIAQENGNVSEGLDRTQIAERRDIEKMYGEEIREFVEEYEFHDEVYSLYIDTLLPNLDSKYRKQYVRGLATFVKDGKKHIDNQGGKTNIDLISAVLEYDELFKSSVSIAEVSKQESKERRTSCIVAIGSSLVIMILFLIIPLLLQIEINTRPENESAS